MKICNILCLFENYSESTDYYVIDKSKRKMIKQSNRCNWVASNTENEMKHSKWPIVEH